MKADTLTPAASGAEASSRSSGGWSPDDPATALAQADALYDAGRYREALAILAPAARARPNHPPTRNLLAMTLAATGDTAAAIAQLRATARLAPAEAGVWANLGLLLKDDGHFDAAIAAYDTAARLAPDNARIRVNRVVALLRAGRWTEAWPDYEWRLRLTEHATRRRRLLPMVSTLTAAAGRPLAGLTILAVHEDGFGDTLHFARYLPLLAKLGARVTVAVPPALTRIMRRVEGVHRVHGLEEPWPPHDFYCPFFSLPRAFETTPDTIPAPPAYLRVRADRAAIGRRWLAAAGSDENRFRVGLVWAGQARPAAPGFGLLDGRRSLALAAFAPFAAIPGVEFVSLQYGPEAIQARTPPAGMRLIDPMGEVRDFADTAGIVVNLDLVVAVDTAIVHLAGGLGKPVFLLDRYDHCWRWLSGREDSPWYPAARIFRQPRIGDWTTPIQAAATALAAMRGAETNP